VGFAAASGVGRLVELRLFGDSSVAEEIQFERDAKACIAACTRRVGRPVVICTDLRASHLFRPAFSERVVESMRATSGSVERSGMLGNGSALFDLQFDRMIKEAGSHTQRRMFAQPEMLTAWLDELLDAYERTRVREFLAEQDSSRGTRDAGMRDAASGSPPTPRRRAARTGGD
jgi:hypothetical protein